MSGIDGDGGVTEVIDGLVAELRAAIDELALENWPDGSPEARLIDNVRAAIADWEKAAIRPIVE